MTHNYVQRRICIILFTVFAHTTRAHIRAQQLRNLKVAHLNDARPDDDTRRRRRRRRRSPTSMSDDDEERSFDDARDTFDAADAAVAPRDVSDAGGLPTFVPHEDQRGVDGFDGMSDDDGGSDGVVDADDDFAGSMDDESEGEDLMNDMERCVRAWRLKRVGTGLRGGVFQKRTRT